jgi:methylase of polypeptide subunit release factors
MHKFTYNHEFDFIYGENTFVPTSTSEVLLENIVNDNQELGKTLDLGTGIGFVILMLKLIRGDLIKECFASDLSVTNISYCKQNSINLKVPVEIKQGSLFQPWKNYKFDTIINDVSGVVPLIAEQSGWFKGVPIDCGSDGADLTVKIINEASNHLSEGGKIYTPVLSLQNEKRIYQAIADNGFQYKTLSSHYWPVPDGVAQNVEMLDSLTKNDVVRIDKKFGKLFWYTTIIKIERSTV